MMMHYAQTDDVNLRRLCSQRVLPSYCPFQCSYIDQMKAFCPQKRRICSQNQIQSTILSKPPKMGCLFPLSTCLQPFREGTGAKATRLSLPPILSRQFVNTIHFQSLPLPLPAFVTGVFVSESGARRRVCHSNYDS